MTTGRDDGVLSSRTWRLADLGAKASMLLAGLGWGNTPARRVEEALARGRLKVIRPVASDPRAARQRMGGVYLADRQWGPAPAASRERAIAHVSTPQRERASSRIRTVMSPTAHERTLNVN